jgi:alcohol dehydrogenase (cytochrome c)
MKERVLKTSSRVWAAGSGVAISVALIGSPMVIAQAMGPFTQAQVQDGKAAYDANCAACHKADLTGEGEALPLTGTSFTNGWKARSTRDLYEKIHTSMPLGMGASLSQKTYADITAYILAFNGAQGGAAALTPATDVRLSQILTGGTSTVAATPAPPATPVRGGGGEGEGGSPAGAPNTFAYPARGLTFRGDIKNLRPVTAQMLLSPPAEDWLIYRGGYQGYSFSPLKQIDETNVGSLQLKWSWALNDGGTMQMTPIVHDGVFYILSPGNTVQALNAATGELLWENQVGSPPQRPFGAGADANRSMAIYGDKLFLATKERKLVAMNIATGETVWTVNMSAEEDGYGQTTGGLMVINGKVLSGMTGCGSNGALQPRAHPCFISAYDADTGKRLWKFNTAALTGQPGGDTWNGLPDNLRNGTETWIAGTYDPVLNTTYWGTAQAKPWRRDMRGTADAPTRYANATLALNPDNGELKWFFDHAPGESLDLDEVFERVLIDEDGRKVLLTVGKQGILWKLDRETGQFIAAEQTVFNNVAKVDPITGLLVHREDIVNAKVDQWLSSCPGPQGGHDWQATTYHQPTGSLIIPLSQSCILMLGNGSQKFFFAPGTEGNLGRLSSYDTKTMKLKWTFQQRAPFLSAALSTGGNVLFIGDFDRRLKAIDVRTGKTLWQSRLGTTVQGHPVSFAVDGKQYVAVTTGLGGGSPQQKPMALLPEVHRPTRGNQVYVFGLPD